jgi:hypothetical protein
MHRPQSASQVSNPLHNPARLTDPLNVGAVTNRAQTSSRVAP